MFAPRSAFSRTQTVLPCTITILIALAIARPAFALQTHGGHEGLYVHQGAHLFYLFSMVVFALRIHKSKLFEQPAWRLLSIGIWLLALWNIWAFLGHVITLYVPQEHFIALKTPHLLLYSAKEVWYYLLKMDNLLCVPAVLFIFLGLRKMLPNEG